MKTYIEYSNSDIKSILAKKHGVEIEDVKILKENLGFVDSVKGYRVEIKKEVK